MDSLVNNLSPRAQNSVREDATGVGNGGVEMLPVSASRLSASGELTSS